MIKVSENMKMLRYAKKLSILTATIPMLSLGASKMVFAERKIPDEAFVTKERLLEICNETNRGVGLLATGTDSDKKIRIRFGYRPGDVEYYKAGYRGSKTIAQDGPISWLVAGKDGNEEVVLYSEEPIEKDVFLGESVVEENKYDWENLVEYNNWGECDLRKTLQDLKTNLDYFDSEEQKLMLKSSVKTLDFYTNSTYEPEEYITDDTLYAPALKADEYVGLEKFHINVGEKDNLEINRAYWGGGHWLRSQPLCGNYVVAFVAVPNDNVYYVNVFDKKPSISAAFKLDLKSVLFASSAPNEGDGYTETTGVIPPMTLRLDGSGQGIGFCEISEDKKRVNIFDAEMSTLVIQGTKADGTNWSYRKFVDTSYWNVYIDAQEVEEEAGIGLQDFSNCEIWLERPVSNAEGLFYAVRVEESLGPNPMKRVKLS